MSPEAAGDRRLRYLLALSVITLAVYVMALKAGFLAVDDTDTILNIQSGRVSIAELFLSPGKRYYRPLAMLSLLADFHLYGGTPAGYHLTNLLLHLGNVLLVFYLTMLLLGSKVDACFYSFLAALMFALHPVNSEAVVWISARPDLLCCFFFLLSLVILVKRGDRVTLPVFAGLFVTLFCSLASKEASLFLPVLAVAYFMLQKDKSPMKNGVSACGALLLAVFFYLMLRNGLPLTPDTGATTGVQQAGHSSMSVFDGAAAIGFYIGKLIYPFPLSIAITDIPFTLCVAIFLLCAATAAVLWTRDYALRFPLVFMATALIPPLGALFLSTAWTPYAERYLYLPSIAFALCATMAARGHGALFPKPVLVAVAILAAIPTAYRVHLWTQPVAFWQDAVSKTPRFATLRLPLAAELIEEGRVVEAQNTLEIADKLGYPRKEARDFSLQLKDMIAKRSRTPLEPGATGDKVAPPASSGAP